MSVLGYDSVHCHKRIWLRASQYMHFSFFGGGGEKWGMKDEKNNDRRGGLGSPPPPHTHTHREARAFWLPVISYQGHFVPRSFRTYFGHFVPSNNHFVPRPFRTHFGHFVPRSTGYEMTIRWPIRTEVILYPFWTFRTHFGHFVPSKDGWMDWRTDRQVCFDWNDKLTSYS